MRTPVAVCIRASLLLAIAVLSVGGVQCGVNIPAPTAANPMPVAAADLLDAGVAWVRIEYIDTARDQPAPSALSVYDPLIDALSGAGIGVLLLVDYSSWLDVPAFDAPCAPDWTQYTQGYAARLQALAQHYRGRVRAFEVWNEEDFANPSPAYDPSVRAACYAPLLGAAYAAVKAAGANATVVIGGLASGNTQYVVDLIDSHTGRLTADAIGVHPYGRRPTNDWPSPTWGFGPLIPFLDAYTQALGSTSALPFFVTEMGTDDTQSQPQFPYHFFSALNATTPAVWPVAFWFCWTDAMVPPFGLLDAAGNKKPSYYSYQQWCLQK